MPAILDNQPCPSCGGQHTLCLDDHAQAWANRDYSYTCPVTRQTAIVHTAAWDRVGPDRPDDAVTLTPAGG